MRLHTIGLLSIAPVICLAAASAPSFNDHLSALRLKSIEPRSNLWDALNEVSGWDFWRELKKFGEKAADHAETMLEEASITFGIAPETIQEFKLTITDTVAKAETMLEEASITFGIAPATIQEFKSTITDIVAKAEAFRDEVQNEITKHNLTLTLEDISNRLTTELTNVFEELKAEFTEPLPEDKTERYKWRESILNSMIPKIEDCFVECAAMWHMSEEDARTRFQEISPHIRNIILITGNVIDHHPVLIGTLLFTVAIYVIPESWFLRPILNMLGFGTAGPVKGSAAAWAQSRFYGAVIEKGSLFASLQQAGMTGALDIVKLTPLAVAAV